MIKKFLGVCAMALCVAGVAIEFGHGFATLAAGLLILTDLYMPGE